MSIHITILCYQIMSCCIKPEFSINNSASIEFMRLPVPEMIIVYKYKCQPIKKSLKSLNFLQTI
jgi:hypothetical protein